MPDTPQVGNRPAEVDFIVQQGDSWVQPVQLFQDADQTTPFDLTGYGIRMQVRNRPTAGSTDSATLIELSTVAAGGKVVITDPAAGQFELRLTDAETAAIAVVSERHSPSFPEIAEYYYDLELVAADGTVRKMMRGRWKLIAEVTA